MVGPDICGIVGETEDHAELCARWTMLGAFYPFSRNHRGIGLTLQEPYQFANETYEGTVTYTDIMRRGIRNKYCLIKYHYTEYFSIYMNGGVYYKPMFFEFPDNDNSFDIGSINYDFMLGSALKVGI